MKWLAFHHAGRDGFGTLVDGVVHVHDGDLFDAPRPTGQTIAVDAIAWRPPCRPTKMLALWNNFGAAAEKNGWARPAEPLYFVKTPNTWSAHGAVIPVPAGYDGRVLYEGELAVVLGRRARAVSVDEARACIFGYTCANDATALELLSRDPTFPQWTRAKGFDGFAPFGPVIETTFDPAEASVRTLLGGRVRQDYPLSDMLFGPAELVARISHDMTLEPGDVILCGTSLGAMPMKPGTEVRVEIDGIGALVNVYGG